MMLESVLTGSIPLHSDDNQEITAANNRSNKNQQSLTNEIQDEKAIHPDKIKSIVSELNEMTKPLRTNLHFQLHEKLNEYYVEVINPLTKEIIKEIPPKQLLDKYAAMAEFMGILVDEKA